MNKLAFAGAAMALLAAAPGLASAADAPPPAVQSLLDCRKLGGEAEQLACFKARAAEFDAALAHGELIVVEKKKVEQSKRETFGFSLPSLSFLGSSDAAKPISTLVETATAVSTLHDGRYVVRLESGATWEQNDQTRISRAPRVGSKIEIRKGALSNYFMSVDGQVGVPAVRRK